MKNPVKCSLLFLLALSAGFCGYAPADTIVKKDGTELKGVLVEEYGDRFILSTIDGEVPVLKDDVKDLVINDEEANLLRLAEKAGDAGDYDKAAAYYERALKLNPDSAAAKKGGITLKEKMLRQDEAGKGAYLSKQEEIDRYGAAPAAGKKGDGLETLGQRLYNTIGFKMVSEDGCHIATNVKKASPASWAGIRNGDTIIAVQGKLICYYPAAGVIKLLLKDDHLSIACTIERTVRVDLKRRGIAPSASDLIGSSLYMGSEGITVKDVKSGGASNKAGLEAGDIVTAIDGAQTRYLPIAKAMEMIRSSKKGYVKMTVRRGVVIWKENL